MNFSKFIAIASIVIFSSTNAYAGLFRSDEEIEQYIKEQRTKEQMYILDELFEEYSEGHFIKTRIMCIADHAFIEIYHKGTGYTQIMTSSNRDLIPMTCQEYIERKEKRLSK